MRYIVHKSARHRNAHSTWWSLVQRHPGIEWRYERWVKRSRVIHQANNDCIFLLPHLDIDHAGLATVAVDNDVCHQFVHSQKNVIYCGWRNTEGTRLFLNKLTHALQLRDLCCNVERVGVVCHSAYADDRRS